jgi:uncharacterized peroxidase-related enzyme
MQSSHAPGEWISPVDWIDIMQRSLQNIQKERRDLAAFARRDKEAAMDQRASPSPRLAPLPPEPALKEQFEASKKSLGFIPNSLLIMQRKPKMVKAWAQMTAAVWDPESAVDRGFKRLIAHVASRAAGCQYCMAHTAGGAMHFGVEDAKVAALWDYQTSPFYTEAERAALDVAAAAASVPNGVTDAMFAEMRKHWSEEQIVEIVGVIAMFGFLNRWNDTMGTPLEDEPLAIGERHLARHGWTPGKHRR